MKRIKDSVASLLYHLIVFIVKLMPASKGKKHLLLIKPDEIGDYMLFRSFLSRIRTSEKYKDHKITILGNSAWKPIFDEYDKSNVDDAIWISKKKFNRDLYYRFKLLKQMRKLGISDVVSCIYSKTMILDNGFAMVATADNKIGMMGNSANRGKYSINFDKLIYTNLIDAGNQSLFETIRNRNYYSQVLGINDLSLDIRLKVVVKHKLPTEPYFVMFIGAGNKPDRKWPIVYFEECAKYVYDKYGLIPVICGGPVDIPDAERFMRTFPYPAINYAGKTTLPEFIEILSAAHFLLSVDTGPVHMAVAASCPVVGLYSGVFYGRYAPYPPEVTPKYISIYPDFIDELVMQNSPILYDGFTLQNNTIRMIPVSKVLPEIDRMIVRARKLENVQKK